MTTPAATRGATVQDRASSVSERVTVQRMTEPERRYLLKPDGEWTAADLRDYVVSEMLRVHGPSVWVRDPAKELSIFKKFVCDFCETSMELAVAIARLAYGQHKGIWRDTPITPARFSKGNYRYFADPLLAQLTAC